MKVPVSAIILMAFCCAVIVYADNHKLKAVAKDHSMQGVYGHGSQSNVSKTEKLARRLELGIQSLRDRLSRRRHRRASDPNDRCKKYSKVFPIDALSEAAGATIISPPTFTLEYCYTVFPHFCDITEIANRGSYDDSFIIGVAASSAKCVPIGSSTSNFIFADMRKVAVATGIVSCSCIPGGYY